MAYVKHAEGTATVGDFATGKAVNCTLYSYNNKDSVSLWYTDHQGNDFVNGTPTPDGFKVVKDTSVAVAVKDHNGREGVLHVGLLTKSYQFDIDGVKVAEGTNLNLFYFRAYDSTEHGTVPPAVQ